MSKFKGQENLKNLQIQHEIITHNCAPYDILMPVQLEYEYIKNYYIK